MSLVKNGEFFRGETWVVDGQVKSQSGQPLDMTGGRVLLRMEDFSSNGTPIIDLSTSTGGGSLTNAASGQFEFVISPAQQDSANVLVQHYRYEIKAYLASNESFVQVTGTIEVKPSLFQND